MANTYPGDHDALAAGSEAWADTVVVYDTSAFDGQSSGAGQKEMTIKDTMGGAWASTYDAAGSETTSTTPKKIDGGAAWDGTRGPAAYNCTITATTFDGITPTIGGIYHIHAEFDAAMGAEAAATVAVYANGVALTGLACKVQNGATAAEFAIPKRYVIDGYAALTAAHLVDLWVTAAAGTPTITYTNLVFSLFRMGPSA